YLGAWEPLAFNIDRSFQLLFMVIIGGVGLILCSFLRAALLLLFPLWLLPRRRLHPHFAHHARSGAARLGHPGHCRNRIVAGAHYHRRVDLLSADRRAARLCSAVVDRQGEIEALALPLLRVWLDP